MGNTKIYEIKTRANQNASVLFSKDKRNFYWNHAQFQSMDLGEHVFFVNKTGGYVFHAVIDKKEISTTVNNGSTKFKDPDTQDNYTVDGEWPQFIRLNIIEYKEIPADWYWLSLGNSESTYIGGNNVQTIENNVLRIKKLLGLLTDNRSRDILLSCEQQLTNQVSIGTGGAIMPFSLMVKNIHKYIAAKGFQFSLEDIANYYLCLKTKPFVILAGISGTGKTQLVRLFAEAINAKLEPIPVKPDWTDNTDLVGYKNLQGSFEGKKLINIIAEACKEENANKVFFVLLDEMNLARVEHYFSDFLSVIETRQKDDGRIVTDKILHKTEVGQNDQELCKLYFPDNFYLVGTVNMDETTHPFSRKVLDRANSIELNEVHLKWHNTDLPEVEPLNDVENDFLKASYVLSRELSTEDKNSLSPVLEKLVELNDILKKADLQFGYRVRDEICFYMLYRKNIYDILPFETALDFQIMQKILPRIQGSSQRIKRVIIELIKHLSGKNDINDSYNYDAIEEALSNVVTYPKSLSKLLFMLRRFEDDGFTSFWL